MGFFKKNKKASKVVEEQNRYFDSVAQEKSAGGPVSQEDLIKTFITYFAPNEDFYSDAGSPKYVAYFNAVNAARDEMISDLGLFMEAIKWSPVQLAELLNNPKPGLTNMMICGLVFKMGEFAVIKDAVYCVDFSEMIPNCIALYFLLISRTMPEEKRKFMIDAGDGTDKSKLLNAMEALKVCEPTLQFTIL